MLNCLKLVQDLEEDLEDPFKYNVLYGIKSLK